MRVSSLGMRIALLCAAMVTLTVVVAVGLGYLRVRGEMERALTQELSGLAVSVAMQVPGDSLAFVRVPGDTLLETYESLRAFLRLMRTRGGLKDDFALLRSGRGQAEVIVGAGRVKLLFGAPVPARDEFLAAIREGRPQVTAIMGEETDPDRSPKARGQASAGMIMRAYAPIRSQSGGVVAALEITRQVEAPEATLGRVVVAWVGPWLLLVSLSILAGLLLSESATAEVRTLATGVEQVAGGALDAAPTLQGREEAGRIARAVKNLASHIKDMLQEILGMSTKVAESAGELSSAASQISTSVQEVTATVQEIAKGTALESVKIADIKKEIEKLNQLTKQVDSQLKLALVSARKAQDSAGLGREATRATVTQMTAIASVVEDGVARMKRLTERSRQIKQVLDFITSVAEQTDMLALNAAIEAARVGEQGRGFTVVAEEIRKLAVESAQAASEVGALILEVRNDIAEASGAISQGAGSVAMGKEIVEKMDHDFEAIANTVTVNSTMIQEISHVSKEQAMAADEILRAIGEISQAALQISANVEEVAAATEEEAASMQEMTGLAQNLANLAGNLKDLVRRFKV
jgi:methyl-accepting chemotaxis protein